MGAAAIVSKAEFAAICNADASAVSRWIKAGKISGKAIVGDGRSAKINVEEAQRQLRIKLDSSQRLGNGLGTKLNRRAPPAAELGESASEPGAPDPDHVLDDALDAEIKREKLSALQRANRKGAEDEAASQGRYTETASARRQMTMVAVQVLRVFEGAIPELATNIAAHFKLEEREVTLRLTDLFRGVRDEAAKKAAAVAEKIERLAPNGTGEG